MKHPEFILQQQICKYISIQYPKVLFLSDTIANIKLTMSQAIRNKSIQKVGFKCPDLIILQPSKKYNGLFLELKVKSPYKKNGELFKNEHLQGQQLTINKLNDNGYYATFAVGFQESKNLIDWYLTKD